MTLVAAPAGFGKTVLLTDWYQQLSGPKAWLTLVVVELVASSEGLGYLIVYGRQLFQLDLVLASVLVVGAIGYLADRILTLLEARLQRGNPR